MDAIDRIESRTAIADLVHGYALAVRQGDPAAAAALFTADGVFETAEADPLVAGSFTIRNRSEGREAVAAYIGKATSQVRMLPMIHNLIVTLDGDEATATSLMVGRQWPSEKEAIGDYADSFRREGGVWRFAARRYTMYKIVTPPAN